MTIKSNVQGCFLIISYDSRSLHFLCHVFFFSFFLWLSLREQKIISSALILMTLNDSFSMFGFNDATLDADFSLDQLDDKVRDDGKQELSHGSSSGRDRD